MVLENGDALAVLVIAIGAVMIALWGILQLRIQLTPGQAVFMALFCVVLGIFLESWVRDTKEQLLSGMILLALVVLWAIWRGGKAAKNKAKGGR